MAGHEAAGGTEAELNHSAACGHRFGRGPGTAGGPLQKRLHQRRVLGVGEAAVLVLVVEGLHQPRAAARRGRGVGEGVFEFHEGDRVVDRVDSERGHVQATGRVGVGAETCHHGGVGAVACERGIELVVVGRSDVARTDVAGTGWRPPAARTRCPESARGPS